MNPVEKMARAMLAEAVRQSGEAGDFVGDDERWPEVCLDGSFDIEGLARVAIEALREPSDAMLRAAQNEGGHFVHGSIGGKWQAMIDAALNEGPP